MGVALTFDSKHKIKRQQRKGKIYLTHDEQDCLNTLTK
ncbi:hypothetical protein SAMN06265368_1554 [Cohaesibacter gelatinilyticus]|uniref:Uncharacterized protein n=1 Tax=Cohaesibacter gelatinilyticus TaxID=372072 RepID=A0A285NKW6_9HYPH|nr:hypothetical protein SAMN06265368_1554 [Cohaesibacter gelatinilyticus]